MEEQLTYESLNIMRGSMSYMNIADPAQLKDKSYKSITLI